jgi:hypothetical protein
LEPHLLKVTIRGMMLRAKASRRCISSGREQLNNNGGDGCDQPQVRLGHAAPGQQRDDDRSQVWGMRQERLKADYTTKWAGMPIAKAV